jgi:alcohol dehydrogenase class IV
LKNAWENANDTVAREDMSLASLMGGLALANAGLGAAHGFAGPIGGMFPAPHGAVCACLLPHVIAVNTTALQERLPASESLRRLQEISRILTGNENARPDDGVAWVKELCEALQIPSLASYGLGSEHVPSLIKKAAVASSMKNNPIQLTPDEMREILARAL